MKVLIDNGHGIDTPGKRSPDGRFREYLWNREVAQLVLEGLLEWGVDAQLVVRETNDVSLRNRVNRINTICNQLGASNVLLISIHANAMGNGSQWMNAQGWSAYTTKGSTESDKVAEFLYDAFEEEFKERRIRKDMSDGDRDWEENFYILQKTKCPAVLTENFFYDNQEECAFLLSNLTKWRVAQATIKGIINYLKACERRES